MRNVSNWVISLIFILVPYIGHADLSSLPRLETSVDGSYPEVNLKNNNMLGLDVFITYGPLGWKNEKFRTTIGKDRKISVPNLNHVAVDFQKDLLPINVEFSVPSPNILGIELGTSYLRSFVFQTVEEYQSFFNSPLLVSFHYEYSEFSNPMTYNLTTKDGSSFVEWYTSNVKTNAKVNCLFVGVQFLPPQATSGYGAPDMGAQIDADGRRVAHATLLILRKDQPVHYKLTAFTSANPYVCNSGFGSPNESMSKIIMSESRTASAVNFPNLFNVIVP